MKGELSDERLGERYWSDKSGVEDYGGRWFGKESNEVDQTLLETPRSCSAVERAVHASGWVEDFDHQNSAQVHVGYRGVGPESS